jgi:hypothetical protein
MHYFVSFNHAGRVNGIHANEEDARKAHTDYNSNVKRRAVPTDWEMFTAKGNKRVTQLAEQLFVDLLNKKKPEDALTSFCEKFRKLYNTKTMGEAGDTAVREAVYDFVHKFSFMFDFGADSVDRIWERIV